MKVELKDAKVEMEVGGGKGFLYINGQRIPLPREVGVSLIFGEDTKAKPTTPPTKGPGVAKAKVKSRHGCQTPGSKEKLSRSLKAYWRKRKAEEKVAAKATPAKTTKKHLNGKSHLNGASLHIN